MADASPSSSDMLSNLPEHILLHILSFLPTKMAVATSVLSKPWQHLWTLVPAIDLDYHALTNRKDFEHIVSKVLDSNKSPIIRRLRLFGQYCCRTSCWDKWLSSATQRNVEELELNFDFDEVYDDVLPTQHYSIPRTLSFCCAPESCKTLVVMKLRKRCYVKSQFVMSGDLDFPSLKILHLSTVWFESGSDPSLSGFFSSRFPLLEELAILGVTFHHDINVSLPMLRRLEIQYGAYSTRKYTLNIEAPSLQFLVLRSFGSGGFRVENLPNLVEANVGVFDNTQDNESHEYGESLVGFVNALSNVKRLDLSLSMMWALSAASFHVDRIRPFHNLLELDIPGFNGSVLGITMTMLSKFQNLEHLKITKSYDKSDNTEYCFTPPTHVPYCLTHHLKTFCFEDFGCSKYEMEFTKYILNNSLVLENAKIIFRHRLFWKKGVRNQTILSATSRGSLECQLDFDQEGSESESETEYDSYYV